MSSLFGIISDPIRWGGDLCLSLNLSFFISSHSREEIFQAMYKKIGCLPAPLTRRPLSRRRGTEEYPSFSIFEAIISDRPFTIVGHTG